MPVYGIQAGGIEKLSSALDQYSHWISTDILKDTEATLKKAIKGDSSIRSYKTVIEDLKKDIQQELTSYLQQTKNSIQEIETAYRVNDQTSSGTIKKS